MRYLPGDPPPAPRPPTPPEHIQEYLRLHWYGPNYQRWFKPKVDHSAPKPHSDAAKRLIAKYGLKKKGETAKNVHSALSGADGKRVPAEHVSTAENARVDKSDSQSGVTVRDLEEKADSGPSHVPPLKSTATHINPDASTVTDNTERHTSNLPLAQPPANATGTQVEEHDQIRTPSSSVAPDIVISDTGDPPEVPCVSAPSMVPPNQSTSEPPPVETDIPMELDSEYGAIIPKPGVGVDDAARVLCPAIDDLVEGPMRPEPTGIHLLSSTDLLASVDSSQDVEMASPNAPLTPEETRAPSVSSASVTRALHPALHCVHAESCDHPEFCEDRTWLDPLPPIPVRPGSLHPDPELHSNSLPDTPVSGIPSSTSSLIPRTPTPPWGYRPSADIQHDARSLEEPVEAALIACFIAAEARLERMLAPARQGLPPWRPATFCGAQWLESVPWQEQRPRDAGSNSETA